MPKIQFDRQDVLNKATSLFWREGYSATSMQALFEVTGLKPGSVYLAFGNKEDLFKESIDFYGKRSIEFLQAKLSHDETIESGICELLLSFVDESTQTDYCSCFLLKSQLELDNQAPLKQHISDYLLNIENIYSTRLSTIYGEEEAKQKAASVMVHIFGIRVYGYHTNSKEQILSSLKLGLHWLPWSQLAH
ncbi:TetR/AcrR family transcriptional regulator [Pseudocolwellia sp. HL-MZ19]|uniref:TetR/AcrR family transcriptional regulator n=1 Tax=unclassified Pseudocolwellia TaxID=2848178 RepID=UPI003CF6900A